MDTCKQNMQQSNITNMYDCNCNDMKNKKMSEHLYKSAHESMCKNNSGMENKRKMCQKPNMVESYVNDYGCPCVEQMPLAMAYVPWQEFNTVYESDEALARGTIFPELDLPFYGRSCNGV